MTKSQKGFSAIEALLLLLATGIIGGTGWYVWHGTSQTNKTLDSASNQKISTPPKGVIRYRPTKDITDFPDQSEWKEYSSQTKYFKYSLKLPSDVQVREKQDYTEVTSPGFELSKKNSDTRLASLTLLLTSSLSTRQGCSDCEYAWNLFKTSGIKSLAEANRTTSVKGNNENPNIANKYIGPLSKVTMSKGEAWGYEAREAYSYSFKEDLSGSLVNGYPEWIIYITDGTDVYTFYAPYGSSVINAMISSLAITHI